MAVKFRIGNWFIVEVDKDSAKTPSKQVDEIIEKYEDQIESKLKNWVKNDRFFDGLRNTYARVLLIVLTWLTLFGFGYLAFNSESLTLWYVMSLVLLGALHQLSVRFVFNSTTDQWFSFRVLSIDSDELVDEYQRARRDRAFHRAYRNLGSFVTALFTAYLVYLVLQASDAAKSFAFPEVLNVNFQLSLSQTIVLVAGISGFFTLQKYIAWGFKGEPIRSKNEPNE